MRKEIYCKAIDKFITRQFEPHDTSNSPMYPSAIYWLKNKEVISIIENETFYVDYQIWNLIDGMFSESEYDTVLIIKSWLEKHYKMGNYRPVKSY